MSLATPLAPPPALARSAGHHPDAARRLDPDALVEIAKGIAASPLWVQHANHDPERRPVRLLATPSYEVWVLGWRTGQRVELHDHGDAAGAIVVTEGTLTEVVADGRTRAANQVTLPAGAVRAIPTGSVHDVVNLAADPATSIHVYSPPLSSMTYYDPVDVRPVRTEAVPPELPTLGPDAAARALHPSRLPAHRA